EKGNQVCVAGRFRLDHWMDKNGVNRLTPIVEATQLAFPPRLKVVSNDDNAADSYIGANPIAGEVEVSAEEGEAIFEGAPADYGSILSDAEAAGEPATASRAGRKKASA